MNIHSLQLPIAFIPVTQSRDWLKERAFYWARSLSLSVSGWLMRGDHYHKVRHHMVITLMMFSQGDQQIQWSERRTTKMFPLFTSQVDKRPSKGERRGSFIFRRDIYISHESLSHDFDSKFQICFCMYSMTERISIYLADITSFLDLDVTIENSPSG